ncbi:MAG: outer membrane protein assembly factor BamD [Calditrichaeota bacterium]|nr:MAG: outer membrane protein assembly factor BamD [Calditrichota bacterium]
MTKTRNLFGTSILSLFLVVWGLFMVCSGRVPNVYTESDLGLEEPQEESNVQETLATLDAEGQKLETEQRNEILQALGIEPGTGLSPTEEELLTEELFLDLQVEIAELEKLSKHKTQLIDSLKMELEEADHQLAALSNLVSQPATKKTMFASSSPTQTTPMGSTERVDRMTADGTGEASYQSALDDVYARRYDQAIDKFRALLRERTNSDLLDNCQYWIGECYYAKGNYLQAIVEFEKVFAYENNNKDDDAQFMIGLAYMRLGNSDLANIELQNLLAFYNNSEYISKAQIRLAELQI